MKTILLLLLFLITKNLVSTEIEEPDDFEQIEAKLLANIEKDKKFTLFEKQNNVYISAFFDNEFLFFEEYDVNLNSKTLSKLNVNSDEYLIFYKFDGENILLLFDNGEKETYIKSVCFNYVSGKIIQSSIIYALLSPDEFKPDEWNKSLSYIINDNKEKIVKIENGTNEVKTKTLTITDFSINQKNGNTLIYNFFESEDENYEVYYSIIDKNGNLLQCERKLLISGLNDKFRYVKGLYSDFFNEYTPIFYVDCANKKERNVLAYTFEGNAEILKTKIPIEINDNSDYVISKLYKSDNNPTLFGIINEENDEFADTYGLISLNFNKNNKEITNKLIVWNENDIESLTNSEDLTTNLISCVRFFDNSFYLILESNESYNVYEQKTYIPVNELRNGLVLKIDDNFKIIWTNYIKNRDVKRIVSCDNGSKVFKSPTQRYALQFQDLTDKSISFYYHSNSDDTIFGYRSLDSKNGSILIDSKLFEVDEEFYLYPNRIFLDSNNNTIMQVSNDCDTHAIKFSLQK